MCAAPNPFATDLQEVQISTETNGSSQPSAAAKPAHAGAGAGLEPLEIEPEHQTGDASWPQAACHTVTAVVGAGVLGLPYAFSYLGWAGGTIFLTITLTSSLYTSWQLAGMHEQDGIRINRYRDLGVYTLGKKWGRLAIAPFQMLVMVGLAVVYTVTGAKSMRIIEVLNTGNEDATMLKYTFIFGVVQLLLSQIPDFAHLWVVSIIGAVMSLCYSLLSGVLAMAAAASDDVPPDYGKRDSGPDFWRGVFTSLGAVTFAYGGHSVLLEIQATLRVPPEAKQSMMRGVYTAYVVSGVCYYFVALAGYGSYGNLVDEDVLLSKPRVGKGWIGVANIMVWLHVVASFQVFTQPVFEALETPLAKHFDKVDRHRVLLRLVWRSVYVILVTIVAVALPFFTDLMGLIGALGFIPMTFVMPCVLYLLANRGKLKWWEIALNTAIIVLFCVIAFSSFVASASSIAKKKRSGDFDFWS